MVQVIYDGSFAGFLSAVFDVYEYRFTDVVLTTEKNHRPSMFATLHRTATDETRADRVWKALGQRLSRRALKDLFRTFLSESTDAEAMLLGYIRYVFSRKNPVEHDFSHPAVLAVAQTARMVHREKHRMEAFIRFQLTRDDLYYALVEPDFNVLPLIRKHFQDRYADQCSMIYDVRRKYGLYYDKIEVVEVSVDFETGTGGGKNIRSLYHDQEELYQKLWQQYFNSVNIAARKNMPLHIRHMPKRYWKYVTEKSVS